MENPERSPGAGTQRPRREENNGRSRVQRLYSVTEDFVDHFNKDLGFYPKSSGKSLKGFKCAIGEVRFAFFKRSL